MGKSITLSILYLSAYMESDLKKILNRHHEFPYNVSVIFITLSVIFLLCTVPRISEQTHAKGD